MEAGEGQSNRLFILLALAILGLICIGLLGLGFFLAFVRQSSQTPGEVVLATPVLLNSTFTPTPTITPIPPTPTNTPEPTPTGTLVVGPTPQEAAVQRQPRRRPLIPT